MTSIHMLTHMTYTCLPAYTCKASNTHPYPHIYTKKKKSGWERLETCLIWSRKQGTCLFVSGFIEMVWCLAAILPAFTASSRACSEVASRDQIDESVTGVRFEPILSVWLQNPFSSYDSMLISLRIKQLNVSVFAPS